MTVNTENNSRGEWTLVISGRIDNNTAETLRAAIAAVPAEVGRIVLDFRDVFYISSAGLRELMICRKRFPEERMVIRNVGQSVMEVLEMTGFSEVLPLENTDRVISTYVNESLGMGLYWLSHQAGDRIALKNERDTYTWSDVDRAAQIIAEDLSRLGVRRGSHVGICGRNSVNWVLVFFAVQKLNAMAMLINPGQTSWEIARVCEIGDISFLCCGEGKAMEDPAAFEEDMRAAGCPVLAYYSFRNSIDMRDRFPEYAALEGKYDRMSDPDAPCVVIFTSGSTGRPKGVILSSYNLLNAAAVQARNMQMAPEDRELLLVPLYHILGLAVCLLPCAISGTTLFIPDNIHTDTLIRLMRQEKFTLVHAVPTMIMAMMGSERYDRDAADSLRCMMLAGARIDEAVMRRFMEALPNNHFIIAYGLSEMAPVTQTVYGDTADHILHTVGKAVDNISLRIVDPGTGAICPAGIQGEIQVQGFNLMTGYYKLPPEKQAIDGEGWLHTGDMGYLDEEGYLTLTGRYKDLIIRGGENIMPAEIEEVIAEMPEVRQVRAVGIPDPYYGEVAVACVVMMPGAVWDEAAVRAMLSGKLARYKIPAFFLLYDDLPVLGSGKIDTVKLRKDAEQRIRNQR